MLAALAGIGAGEAHVEDPAKIQVIGDARQWPRGQFHCDRAILEVERNGSVGCVGIGREEHVVGPGFQDMEGLVLHLGEALEERGHGNVLIEKTVGPDRPIQIGVVISPPDGFRRRKTALEGVLVSKQGRPEQQRGEE